MDASVIIDLGNSETRVIVLYDKPQSKSETFKRKRFTFSNRFAEIDSKYTPSSNYTEDTTTIFKANGKLNDIPVDEVYYANGELQEKEFYVGSLRPSATEKKYNSLTTILSYELAILRGTEFLMNEKGVAPDDISWFVTILLPPGDMEVGQSRAVALVKSVKRIESTFPKMSFSINLKRVSVLQEGFCAYIATVFERGQKLRTNFKYLLSETTLVLDIGAGTTDFLVVRDNKIIESTRHTVARGGNNVTQIVRKRLSMEYDGLNLPESIVAKGIENGFVKDGSKSIDITGFTVMAKDEVAKQLVSDAQGYLEETEYPIRTIGRLICCGGGAIGINEGGTTKALSEAVVTYFKKLSPNIELVELPRSTDGIISPRDLNVVGGSILGEVMQMQEKK